MKEGVGKAEAEMLRRMLDRIGLKKVLRSIRLQESITINEGYGEILFWRYKWTT